MEDDVKLVRLLLLPQCWYHKHELSCPIFPKLLSSSQKRTCLSPYGTCGHPQMLWVMCFPQARLPPACSQYHHIIAEINRAYQSNHFLFGFGWLFLQHYHSQGSTEETRSQVATWCPSSAPTRISLKLSSMASFFSTFMPSSKKLCFHYHYHPNSLNPLLDGMENTGL